MGMPLKEKLINYLNQALVEMRDQYLTQLMGGPTYKQIEP